MAVGCGRARPPLCSCCAGRAARGRRDHQGDADRRELSRPVAATGGRPRRPLRRRGRPARATGRPLRRGRRGLRCPRDQAKRRRTPLAERALERSLAARRLVASAPRRTVLGQRTGVAAWNTCDTDGRAEIHERLRGRSCEGFPVLRRTRSTLTSTGRTSSPNAKQRRAAAVYGPTPGSSVRSSGQPVGGDPVRSPLELHCAPVVAEPLPLSNDTGRRGRRERLDARPALEPRQVARNDSLDLRLLEHHLRDEDRVRVTGPAPRKIAAVLLEPVEQERLHHEPASGRRTSESLHVRSHQAPGGRRRTSDT